MVKRLALCGFFCLIGISSVFAQPKTALVIGNGEYQDAPLANPVNDATDMAQALRDLGFDVMALTNADRQTMREAIREFGEKLKKGGVGLFYYAGHGMQIKGQNYLIPVKADIKAADEVEDESIDANSVLRKMETAGNDVNIIILDACRNNPFARSFRSAEQGLAKMEGPVGSIIAYATAPGSTAYDGSGRNGLYTSHLLKAIKTPGLTIEEVFKHVRVAVRDETQGQQIPWESSSLTGNFQFIETSVPQQAMLNPALTPTPPPPPPLASALGLVQVTANVVGGRVFVNGEERGVIPGSHALNLQNLPGDTVEIRIEQAGYRTQMQRVALQPGVWQQVYFEMLPETSSSITRNTETAPSALPPAQATVALPVPIAPGGTDASQAPVKIIAAPPVEATEFDFNTLIKPATPGIQNTVITPNALEKSRAMPVFSNPSPP